MASTAEAHLTKDQIEQFQEKGYLMLPGYLDEDTTNRLKDEADRLLELTVNTSLATNRQSQRLSLNEHGDGSQSVRNIQPFIDISREYKRIGVTDLPPLLRPLMDDDPVSMDRTSQLNYKQPLPEPIPELDGAPFTGNYPVHADWPYFEGKATAPTKFIIGSVFIDECTKENGALEIWPGSHTRTFEHEHTELGAYEVPPETIDHDAGKPIRGPAGSILFFDAKLVHSSSPNVTDGPRRLAIYRHAPAKTVNTDVKGGSARPEGYGFPQECIESTFENEYHRLKRKGQYNDEFTAPEL